MNSNICPIVNPAASAPKSCPIVGCQHRVGISCSYMNPEDALEGDLTAVSQAFLVSPVEIRDGVDAVQSLIVASRWFAHHTGENLLDANRALLEISRRDSNLEEFTAWNTSPYSWDNVKEALGLVAAKSDSRVRC